MFAVPGTEQAALSYSNMSAAHMDMEMYSAAVRDVELAFEAGIPEDKKRKLSLRKIDCLLNLNKEEEAIELLDQLSFESKGDFEQIKEKIIQKVLNKDEAHIMIKQDKELIPKLEDPNKYGKIVTF